MFRKHGPWQMQLAWPGFVGRDTLEENGAQSKGTLGSIDGAVSHCRWDHLLFGTLNPPG